MTNKPKKFTQIQFHSHDPKLKLLPQTDLSTSRSSIKSQQQQGKEQPKHSRKTEAKKEKKKFSWPVYKKLFRYTMKRWRLALASLVLTIISGFLTSVIPYQVGDILDSITEVRTEQNAMSMNELNGQILGLLYVTVGLGVFTYLRYSATQNWQELLAIDMRMDIYSKFITNDMYFFQQYKSGEFVSRLGSDINQAKSAVSNNLTFMMRNSVTIVSNIIFLFFMSWKLTLSVMTVIPFFSAVTIYYSKKYKPLVKEYSDVTAEMSAHVSQKISGIQLVKAYSNETNEIQNYRKINEKAYEVAKKQFFVQGFYLTCSTFLPVVGTLIVLWYGGKLSIQGNAELTPGQLTSFIMYCTYLANNTTGISSSYANIINGTAAMQKVFDMLSYQPEIHEDKGMSADIQGDITFQNVCFSYPSSKVQLFNNLNFSIKKGEYVAFAGQSGSGKSTIIKLIEKFYKTTNGKILFSGIESIKLNSRQLRKKIGMVNQEATIFSGTIEQNITYGLQEYTGEQLKKASQRAGCLEFINNKALFPDGFKTVVGEKGHNLSGGQRQRISIARALMRKPKIIIFDEATSALDANSEQMVKESIEGIASSREDRITIIVIAHRLSTIINADRILVMRGGQLIEEGTHDQLKDKKGYYYELVQKQLQEN